MYKRREPGAELRAPSGWQLLTAVVPWHDSQYNEKDAHGQVVPGTDILFLKLSL